MDVAQDGTIPVEATAAKAHDAITTEPHSPQQAITAEQATVAEAGQATTAEAGQATVAEAEQAITVEAGQATVAEAGQATVAEAGQVTDSPTNLPPPVDPKTIGAW